MTAHFTIEVEPDRDLVSMTLSGFFQPKDVAAFVEARDAAHRDLKCGPGAHSTLVDMRAMAIQSQKGVELFRAVLYNPRTRSRRLAFVVARSLARLQIQRAAGSRDAGFFDDPDEARTWALGGRAEAKARAA